MTFPVFVREEKKEEKKDCRVETRETRQANVRPRLKEIIERRLKAHASTWQELAKR
jgi:hypothetical protein